MTIERYIGIDPGLNGAIAVLGPGDELEIFDMPTLQIDRGGKKKRELDLPFLRSIFCSQLGMMCRLIPDYRHIFLEAANAMPGQGVSSVFSFGKSYGSLLGMLAALEFPITTVHPAKWKRALSMAKGKDASRQRAAQLFPMNADDFRLVKYDGRAEAALIAFWGREKANR